MNLFLLRHADAAAGAPSDRERPLSDKGIAQSHRAGKFCRKQERVPDVILHSPLKRAEQTAVHFAEAAGITRILAAEFLSPGMTAQKACAELASYSEFGRVMLVGHEPDFGRLAAALIGLPNPRNLRVRKGSLILIELAEIELGEGRLECLVPSKMM
jgi:phosphohistidine phosphatase